MIGFGQRSASMSAPTNELERRMLEREFNHAANPVLRWMASNVSVKQDAAGNMKPYKSKSTERIDGIVASLMALGRVIQADEERGSLYDSDAFSFL
jgi:phage terminase large subunit-like protein